MNRRTDVAVIGGGPAGLAAAAAARAAGAAVTILERDFALGGILSQCIHDGFGLHLFGERLTGPEYAQRFVDRVRTAGVEALLETMVLSVSSAPSGELTVEALNSRDGSIELACGAVVLAMGCRERTRAQIMIPGDRPAGVYTAGTAQRFVNIDGLMPGRRIVILGSGDVGLIMARRLTLEGASVVGVYEILPQPNGLTRNVVQCLDDYGIPLHLSHTVVDIHGRDRLEAVTVARVDERLQPVPGTEERVACDTLILSVGLIPENELSRAAGAAIDPATRGPVVDDRFATSVPGLYACGNVVHVHDLVDYVSLSAEVAGRAAAERALAFRAGVAADDTPTLPVTAGDGVAYVVPQRVRPGAPVTFYLRVRRPLRNARVTCTCGAEQLAAKRERVLRPPEMVTLAVPAGDWGRDAAGVVLTASEATAGRSEGGD
ncbi:MAG: NAD(P)/FAD-dependent oxidoreductase [Chloroflexota bacterium]